MQEKGKLAWWRLVYRWEYGDENTSDSPSVRRANVGHISLGFEFGRRSSCSQRPRKSPSSDKVLAGIFEKAEVSTASKTSLLS